MVNVIQNYPVGYAGDIKASTGTLQKTTEVSATATFNIESFIKQKESEGFIRKGNTLVKYKTESYKGTSGDIKNKELRSEEIIFDGNNYVVRTYKIYNREGKSPTSKVVKEETYNSTGVRIARRDYERGSSGKELSETRSDYLKGKEKTITQSNVSTAGVGSSEVKTPLKEGTPGLIITSEKGSSIYNVSQGISKPELVATTKPIITTGKVEKVELGAGTVQITETKTIPVIQESVFIQGKGYSVAKELQSEFKVPETGTIKTVTEIKGYEPTKQYAPKEGERPEIKSGTLSEESIKAFKSGGVIGIAGGTAIGAIGFAKGAGEAIARTPEFFSPITYEGTAQVPVITPLYQFGKSVYTGELFTYAKDQPFEFAGGVAGGVIGGKAISKVYAGSTVKGYVDAYKPTVNIRTSTLPQESGVPTTVKTLSIEQGGRSFIVGGVKNVEGKTSVSVGTPDISPQLKTLEKTGTSGEGIRISTPTETKIIREGVSKLNEESFKDPLAEKRVKEFIPAGQEIIKRTQTTQSSFKTSFDKGTEFLNPEATQTVLEIVKEEKGYVSGSFSRSAQLSKDYVYEGESYILNKIPKDIDIHLEGTPESIQGVAQRTLKALQDKGFDVRLKGEGGVVKNAIEIRQPDGTYAKAVEFLGEGTIPEESIPPDTVLGFKKEGAKIDVGGVKATSLSEELRGTLQGTARLRRLEDGTIDIYPREGRVKDIGSVSVSARTLQQSKLFGAGKLQTAIERFESLYPDELVKSQVEKVGTESKVLLADFRSTSSGVVESPRSIPTTSGVASSFKSSSNVASTSTSTSTIPSDFGSVSTRSIAPSTKSPSISSSTISIETSTSPSNIPSTKPSTSTSSISTTSASYSTPSTSTSTYSTQRNITSTSPSTKSPSPPSLPSVDKNVDFSTFPKPSKKRGKRVVLFVRKKGKFERKGLFDTAKEAFQKGVKETSTTARASFKTVYEGENKPFISEVLPEQFRTSKKDQFVVVQKRKYRIGTPGEKQELKQARQVKRQLI